MTVQSTNEFNATTGSNVLRKEYVAKLVKAWESKNAERTVRGTGLGLVAVSLAACGGSGESGGNTGTTPVADGITRLTLVSTDVGKSYTLGEGPNLVTAEVGALAPFRDVALTQIIASAGDDDTLVVKIEFADDFSPLQLRDIENIIIRAQTGSITGEIDLGPITGLTTVLMESLLANQTLTVINVDGSNIIAGSNVLNLFVKDIGTGQIDAGDLQRLNVTASDQDVEISVDGARVEKGILELTVDLAPGPIAMATNGSSSEFNMDASGSLTLETKNAPTIELYAPEVSELVVSALDTTVTTIDLLGVDGNIGHLDGGNIIRLNNAVIDVKGIDAGVQPTEYYPLIQGSGSSKEQDGIDVGGWQVRNIEIVNGVLTDVTSSQNIMMKGLGTFVELQGENPNTTHIKAELEGDRGSVEFYDAAQLTLTIKGDSNLEYFNVSNIITNLVVNGDLNIDNFIADLSALNLPSYASAQIMFAGKGNVTLGYGTVASTLEDGTTNGAKTINALGLDGTLTLTDVDVGPDTVGGAIGSADDVAAFLKNVVKFNNGELVLQFANDTSIYASDLAKLKSVDIAGNNDLTVFDLPVADFTTTAGRSAFGALLDKFVNIDDPLDDVTQPAPRGQVTLIGATDADFTVSYRQLVGRDFDIRIGTEGDGKATILNIGEGSAEATIKVGDLFVSADTGRPGDGPVFLSGAANYNLSISAQQLGVVAKITAAGTGNITVTGLVATDFSSAAFADIIGKIDVATGKIVFDASGETIELTAAQLATIDTLVAQVVTVNDIPTSSVAQMGAILAKLSAGTSVTLNGAAGANLSLTEAQVMDQAFTVKVNGTGTGTVTISEIGFGDADKSVTLDQTGVLDAVLVDATSGKLNLVAAEDVSVTVSKADIDGENVSELRVSGDGDITVTVTVNDISNGAINGFAAMVAKLKVEGGDITIDAGTEAISLTAAQLATIDTLVADVVTVNDIPTSSVAQMGAILAKLSAGTSVTLNGAAGANLSLTEAQVMGQAFTVDVKGTGIGTVTISEIGFGDADKSVTLDQTGVLDAVSVDATSGKLNLVAAEDISVTVSKADIDGENVSELRVSGDGDITVTVTGNDLSNGAINGFAAMVAKLKVEGGDITIDAGAEAISLTAAQLATIDALVAGNVTITDAGSMTSAQLDAVLAKISGTSVTVIGADGADFEVTQAQLTQELAGAQTKYLSVEATGDGVVTVNDVGIPGNTVDIDTLVGQVTVTEFGGIVINARDGAALAITETDRFGDISEINGVGGSVVLDGSEPSDLTTVQGQAEFTAFTQIFSGYTGTIGVEFGTSGVLTMTSAQLAFLDSVSGQGGNTPAFVEVEITQIATSQPADVAAILGRLGTNIGRIDLSAATGADVTLTAAQFDAIVRDPAPANPNEPSGRISTSGDGVVNVTEVSGTQPGDWMRFAEPANAFPGPNGMFNGILVDEVNGGRINLFGQNGFDFVGTFAQYGNFGTVTAKGSGDITVQQITNTSLDSASEYAGLVDRLLVETGTINLEVVGDITLSLAQLDRIDSLSGTVNVTITDIPASDAGDIAGILAKVTANTDPNDTDPANNNAPVIGEVFLVAERDADVVISAVDLAQLGVTGGLTVSGNGSVVVTEVSFGGQGVFADAMALNSAIAKQNGNIELESAFGADLMFTEEEASFFSSVKMIGADLSLANPNTAEATITNVSGGDGLVTSDELAAIIDKFSGDLTGVTVEGGLMPPVLNQLDGANFAITAAQLSSLQALILRGTASNPVPGADLTIDDLGSVSAAQFDALLGKVSMIEFINAQNPLAPVIDVNVTKAATVSVTEATLNTLQTLNATADEEFTANVVEISAGVQAGLVDYSSTSTGYDDILRIVDEEHGIINFVGARDVSFKLTQAQLSAIDSLEVTGDLGEVTVVGVGGAGTSVPSSDVQAIIDAVIGDDDGATIELGQGVTSIVLTDVQLAAIEGSTGGAVNSVTVTSLDAMTAQGVEDLIAEIGAKLAYADFTAQKNVTLEVSQGSTMTISQEDLLSLSKVTAVSGTATLTVTDYGAGASPTVFADVTAVADIETVTTVPSLSLHLVGALGIDLKVTSDDLAKIESVTTGETVTVTFLPADPNVPFTPETDVDLSKVNGDAVVDLYDGAALANGISVTSFDVGTDDDVVDVGATTEVVVPKLGTSNSLLVANNTGTVYVINEGVGSFGDGSYLIFANLVLDAQAGATATLVMNDGVETRIFSYMEGQNAPTSIDADELTLIATFDAVLTDKDILV